MSINTAKLAPQLEKPQEGKEQRLSPEEAAQQIQTTLLTPYLSKANAANQTAIQLFVINAACGGEKGAMAKHNIDKFDIDTEKGLDAYELQKWLDFMQRGLENIIKLENFDDYVRIQQDIETDIHKHSLKAQANKVTGGRTLSELLADSATSISPKRREQLLKLKPGDDDFTKGLMYAIGLEVPTVIEDILLLAGDLAFPAIIINTNQYQYYTWRGGPEYEMKAQAMADAHPIIGLTHMIQDTETRDKVWEMIKGLSDTDKWTAGGIASTLGAVVSLAAGGAGVAKAGAGLAARTARAGSKLQRAANAVQKGAGKLQKGLGAIDTVLPENLILQIPNVIGKAKKGFKAFQRGFADQRGFIGKGDALDPRYGRTLENRTKELTEHMQEGEKFQSALRTDIKQTNNKMHALTQQHPEAFERSASGFISVKPNSPIAEQWKNLQRRKSESKKRLNDNQDILDNMQRELNQTLAKQKESARLATLSPRQKLLEQRNKLLKQLEEAEGYARLNKPRRLKQQESPTTKIINKILEIDKQIDALRPATIAKKKGQEIFGRMQQKLGQAKQKIKRPKLPERTTTVTRETNLTPNKPVTLNGEQPFYMRVGEEDILISKKGNQYFMTDSQGTRIKFQENQILGSGDGADIQFQTAGDYVSGQHVKIQITPAGNIRITDLDSTNGTSLHPQRQRTPETASTRSHEPAVLDGRGSNSLTEAMQTYETPSGARVAASTDKGVNYSKHNEDRAVVDPNEEFIAAIDGMGGEAGGEAAAAILAKALQDNPNDVNKAVKEAQATMRAQGIKEGGAVFASAKIRETGGRKFLDIAHAGDAKVMVFDKHGNVKFETMDDSLVEIQVAMGQKTKDQALYSPDRNIVDNPVTATGNCDIRTSSVELKPGDRVAVMSDGISDNFTAKELGSMITGRSTEKAISAVSRATENRMANADNIINNTPDRAKSGVYADGYKSTPKRDNRAFIVMDA